MNEPPDKIALDLLHLGHLDAASTIAEREIRLATGQKRTTELWRFHFIQAQVLEAHGQVEEALKYLDALRQPDVLDAESCAALKMRRGVCLGLLGRHEHSHRLLAEAEVMARETGLLDMQGDVCLCRAFIFFREKNYMSSDQLFRAVHKIAEQVGGWYLRGHALWGIGKNQMIQGHHKEAFPWLEESLGIFESVGAQLSTALVWGELGDCYLGCGDDGKALDLFQKAAEVERTSRASHNYQVSLASIGNVYLHRRDYFTAISYYQRALSLAREIKDPVSIKKWTRNINLAYARIRLSVDQTNPRVA
jgi:tetratricopeptide (TPR) repeat protein